MLKLSKFNRALRGFPTLLNFDSFIEEGVALGKDGGFTRVYAVRGPDADSAAAYELNRISAKVNQALGRLDTGWMIQADSVRTSASEYPMCQFPDPVSAALDTIRRMHYMVEGVHYESEIYFTLTYLPPRGFGGKSALLLDGDDESEMTRALRLFKGKSQEVMDMLSNRDLLQPRELNSQEMLQFFYGCTSGNWDNKLQLPNPPEYISEVVGSQDFIGGFHPKVGEKHIKVLALTAFPGHTYAGVMDVLNRLPQDYRWHTRFISLSNSGALAEINKARKAWRQRRFGDAFSQLSRANGGEGNVDTNAIGMTGEVEAAEADVNSGTVAYGYYTSVIVLYGETEKVLADNAREIKKALENTIGFAVRLETMNAVEAFLGSLPGHGYPNVRKPLMHTLNLADMLPVTSVWAGHEHHPCDKYPPKSPPLFFAATSGNTPFRGSLHNGDVGHTFIAGPTGQGKSTLLALLAASQLRYPNARVFVLDKGYSMLSLALAVGGVHYDLLGDDTLQLAPLARLSTDTERAQARAWVERLLEMQGVTVTPHRQAAIIAALGSLSNQAQRNLSDFSVEIQDEEIRQTLDNFVATLGKLVNGRSDQIQDNRFVHIEMGHLLEFQEKDALPVMDYLFTRIEQSLDGSPTMIIVDEAWALLKNPKAQERLKKWMRELRKYNAALILATQTMEDIAGSELASVIRESCKTRVYLPNPNALQPVAMAFYVAMGLNEREVEMMIGNSPARSYYFTTEEGRRRINLGLSNFELRIIAASSVADRSRIIELYRAHGATWVEHWLRESPDTEVQGWAAYIAHVRGTPLVNGKFTNNPKSHGALV